MTNTDTAPAAKPKKQQVAVRDWLNSAGQPLESGKESDTAGFRYGHLPSARRTNAAFNHESDEFPAGTEFTCLFADMPQSAIYMLAAFGGQTLAGNVVNTAVNGPKGDPNINPIDLIAARFAEIKEGKWADREAGVGGVRYDREKLATAIAAAMAAGGATGPQADAATYAAKMDWKVDPKTGAQVAPDTKGAISYGAMAMRNAGVKAEYDKLTGGGVQLSSL